MRASKLEHTASSSTFSLAVRLGRCFRSDANSNAACAGLARLLSFSLSPVFYSLSCFLLRFLSGGGGTAHTG